MPNKSHPPETWSTFQASIAVVFEVFADHVSCEKRKIGWVNAKQCSYNHNVHEKNKIGIEDDRS